MRDVEGEGGSNTEKKEGYEIGLKTILELVQIFQ